METAIDCLFVGYNETVFEDYEKRLRIMGQKTVEYRDIQLNFLQYQNKLYTPSDIFNLLSDASLDEMGPMRLSDTFSTTIAYLGSYLHRKGLSFDFVHSFQDEKEKLADVLLNQSIVAVAIPTTYYISIFPIMEIISFIRKHNSEVKIIVGGPFIANCYAMGDAFVLNNLYKAINADFYIYDSQGEQALHDILIALKNSSSFQHINNIAYKDGGQFYTNSCQPEKNILEDNPVDWSLFSDRAGKLVSVRTSMSCPFSCSFCEYPKRAGKYQAVCTEYVEKELDAIHNMGSIKNVGFIDDTFNVPPDRIKSILKMMIKNRYSFSWSSYFRCQYADEEMVELMKESGCDGVVLGIESGSQSILDNMNKAVRVEQYRKGMSLLKQYGITTEASLIIGYVGETLETYQETVDFIEDTKPDFYRPHVWYCSALSPIWDKKDQYGINGKGLSWTHASMDSQTAADLVDKMFLNISNSIWMPYYHFNYPGVISLLTRGYSIEAIKKFICAFNEGIREKLLNPAQKEVSGEIIEKIRLSLKHQN